MKQIISFVALIALLGLTACGEPAPKNRGVFMLIDTSGTYAKELRKAQDIINAILINLDSGDSFAVGRIDTGSFTEKNIVAKITFDDRPSMANREKRQFRDKVLRFVKRVRPSRYTDITGGLLQASEYLNEKDPGKKTILIFSDLDEDLKKGHIRDLALPLDGIDVVALNVTKLGKDIINPRIYLKRLDKWQGRVERGGGKWKVINDLDRLSQIILK